ncbi:hypothetical protein SEA_MILDRED21_73 [Streptomyces phage Mildred21]|uniref:Uncharacterized protein n=1 Tax=Streptomyces phage Mildred21 TaxID=2023959 RepID=A0A222YVS6_9CAUD|nr:hypothetical protein FDI35_gp198 [Streptomyces phage Mildred21]ASR75480.1 hypothetical protein SEA_MILDRED21_73 [Streptomyces phage Mildred21]
MAKKRSPRAKAFELIGVYKKLYRERYQRNPMINSNVLQWGFMAAIDDLEYSNARKALEYFFTCESPGHDVQVFLNKYDKLHDNRLKTEEDQRKRTERLRKTAALVAAMEKKNEEAVSGEH